jgi:hypothetical protein
MQKNYQVAQGGLVKNSKIKKSASFGARLSISPKELDKILGRLKESERSPFLNMLADLNTLIKPIKLKVKKSLYLNNPIKEIDPTLELGSQMFAGGIWNLCGRVKEINKVLKHAFDTKWTASENIFSQSVGSYISSTETPPRKALIKLTDTLLEQVAKNNAALK